MTRPVPADALAAYAAALEAEAALLARLRDRCVAQRDAVLGGCEPTASSAFLAERDRIVASLLEIDSRVRPLRAAVATDGPPASDAAQTRAAAARDLVASLVAEIRRTDAETIAALRRGQEERLRLGKALQAGDAALAAYRRAVAVPTPAASVIRQRG